MPRGQSEDRKKVSKETAEVTTEEIPRVAEETAEVAEEVAEEAAEVTEEVEEAATLELQDQGVPIGELVIGTLVELPNEANLYIIVKKEQDLVTVSRQRMAEDGVSLVDAGQPAVSLPVCCLVSPK